MTVAQWWRLGRPFSLPATVVPVAVGLATAALQGPVRWWAVGLLLVCALLLQIATNIANEYFDYLSGVDDAASVGIAGDLVHGRLAPAVVRGAFQWTYAAALGIGAAPLHRALRMAGMAGGVRTP